MTLLTGHYDLVRGGTRRSVLHHSSDFRRPAPSYSRRVMLPRFLTCASAFWDNRTQASPAFCRSCKACVESYAVGVVEGGAMQEEGGT